ncbi:MAG: DUF3160 domain-containing protein, partial [Polyangiales bacterium]
MRRFCLVASLVCACSSSGGEPAKREAGSPLGALNFSEADQRELARLEQELAVVDQLSASDVLGKRARTPGSLDFDPRSARNLDLLQKSSLALADDELAKLAQQGFVIVPRQAFPNMAYGYKAIYQADLPVYISLDAIMASVHLSYDAILKNLEQTYLTDELTTLLQGARAKLAAGAVSDPTVASDLDLYFAVSLSLLEGRVVEPVAGADAKDIASFVKRAEKANELGSTTLFGVRRELDFSQFKPRGHYEDTEALQRYFRATIWLGRTDFRLIETLPNGAQVFRRAQLDAALALRSVITDATRAAFDHIDKVIGAFVGEHDYMELRQLDALVADLGAEPGALSEQAIAQVIIEKGYGAQRIASQVIYKHPGVKTLPLDRSFALLGQRYAVDSHVFSNVVYDRVQIEGVPQRLLPNPLDAAYAALGNDVALPLLQQELETYRYASHLERMRLLIDEHGEDHWSANLYNLWLSTLRAVSSSTVQGGLASVASTDAWQRRMLNTQLASWAELRHDTILYVKQSYTTGAECEFPDGHVDPYPE